MTVKEFIDQLRIGLNDTDKIEYTDQEIINYINQAQNFISQIAVNSNFRGLLRKAEITLTDGKAKLPDDFLREYRVSGDYQILGDEIYSDSDSLTIYYYSFYPSYTSVNDQIVLPKVFLNLLKEIVIYLALNRTNVNSSFEIELSKLYEKEVKKIISKYGKPLVNRPMPFRV